MVKFSKEEIKNMFDYVPADAKWYISTDSTLRCVFEISGQVHTLCFYPNAVPSHYIEATLDKFFSLTYANLRFNRN